MSDSSDDELIGHSQQIEEEEVEEEEEEEEELIGEDGAEKWVLYRHRDEWSDVTPLPQDDGPNQIVAIAYSERFTDSYNYFRAILKSGEKSERVLGLTENCIWLNTANYTVWQFRREVLKALGKDLKEELKYIDKIMKHNSKNYQAWYHRKVITEWLQDASEELEFTKTILKEDAKNYHAWQHRQWCIKTFNLYDKELDYVEQLLKEDVKNNSAWNQRYFVIDNTTKFEPSIIDREVDFALEKICLVKENESAWNYLRGVLMQDRGGLARSEKVRKKCVELYEAGCRANHLLACIIDICQESCKNDESPESFFHINNALKLCKELSENHDKIRKRYWAFVEQQILQKLEAAS